MFLLVLSICLRVLSAGGSTEEESSSTTIDIFELYAGNLIYDDTDGSCIACNGSCSQANAVSPHSWTAVLEYSLNHEVLHNDLDTCEGYAKDVAEFGVVAFTWVSSNYSCSLHVLDDTHNIAEEMINFNGFDWTEENQNNTGPLFLVRYPAGVDNVDALCYYGLNINSTPNIAKQANIFIISVVVIIIIAWNGWMNHTDNYPPEMGRGKDSDENSGHNSNDVHSIYSPEVSSPKKDE